MSPDQSHSKDAPPYVPMGVLNGYLTAADNIHAPTTTRDNTQIEFRRYVNASGYSDVQLNNGMNRKILTGLMTPFVDYLYAVVPRIPGQGRDSRGGFHKHGIDPTSYQNLVQSGPASQPQDAGGVRQMMGDYLYNPGTS